MTTTRYVVLEWDRPGTDKPALAVDDIFTSLTDAHDLAAAMEAEAKRDNLPTTFTVHAIDMAPVKP